MKYYGDETFRLVVTTNNDESPVDYVVEDTRVATVENGEVTVVAPGVTNILLKQAASGNFAASEEISLPITVNKRPLYGACRRCLPQLRRT